MTIVKCKYCENEFNLELLKYKDVCPYAYCFTRGNYTTFEVVKNQDRK